MVGSKLILNVGNQIRQANNYAVYMDDPAKPLHYLGFNYNRQESVLNYVSKSQLKEQYTAPNIRFLDAGRSNLSELVGQMSRGIELWKWCLVAALFFLLCETLVLRLWR